jgi:hypothetical protein
MSKYQILVLELLLAILQRLLYQNNLDYRVRADRRDQLLVSNTIRTINSNIRKNK